VEQRSGCLCCGKEVLYLDQPESLPCMYCKGVFLTQARCVDSHFICDACHALPAFDLIERFTVASTSTSPLEMAVALMRSSSVKMHGPEHHFLVPAVLLSAAYNVRGEPAEKGKRIALARQRAEHVLGGFCGFYGSCGAAVGTGIFMSVMTGATPLSREEWRLSNLMTSQSLRTIAEAGGPRCCKRNSFLAIREALRFTKDRFGLDLGALSDPVKCEFFSLNKECRKVECPFYPQ